MQPVEEIDFPMMGTRSINIGNNPGASRQFRGEFHRLGIIILKDNVSGKPRALPNDNRSARVPHRGNKSKGVKRSRAKVFKIGQIKELLFCFLQTNNLTTRITNRTSNSVPLGDRINSPNVVAQHRPLHAVNSIRITHKEHQEYLGHTHTSG